MTQLPSVVHALYCMLMTVRHLMRPIGEILIISPIVGLAILIPMSTNGGEARGWAALILLLLAPFAIGIGLVLMAIGKPSKRQMNAASSQNSAAFKSNTVSISRVIFIIGSIFVSLIVIYVLLALISGNNIPSLF